MAAARVAGAIRIIPNLYTSFASCYEPLVSARPKQSSPELDAFYGRLDSISKSLQRDPKALVLPLNPQRNFTFAVIEGLDGSGKSSAVKHLMQLLGGPSKCLTTRTPPASMSSIRPVFDTMEDVIQRAFYSSSNYVAALEILEATTRTPPTFVKPFVLCDRYYSSTVSWTAASALTEEEVNALELPFPEDLVKPDIVLFLDVDHAERIRRTGGRSGAENIVFEEKLANISMANKVKTAFGKVSGLRYEIVDGNRPVEAIAADMRDWVLAVGKSER